MSVRKQFTRAALILAVAGMTAGPAAAQAPSGPPPSPGPGQLPPVPDSTPPGVKSCKGKTNQHKPRCKARPRGRRFLATSAPQYRLGATDCHTAPFNGTSSMPPQVTAADADPGIDHQFARVETFRYKWNGSTWAYETTINDSWAYATDRAFSTYYYTNGRWMSRTSFGSSVSAGHYRIAQRITWHPTKSAPQQYRAFRWAPLTQYGRAVTHCTF